MSQIISSLKWRFGSYSGRKKGKKLTKAIPGRERCSTRLLWNSSGHWKDIWFTYENGMLSGYKEQGVKPADVTINIKTARLTIYGSNEFMRKLNLFKVTTVCNVAHMFAAWSEEQYESWVEILSYAVGKNVEQVSFNLTHDCSMEEESFDNDIIPYDRAMEKDQRRIRDKSKRPSDSRVDSIDSGNDGDESGLESSVSSLSLFETRKRTEMERKQLGLTGSHHSSIQEINNKSSTCMEPTQLISRSLSEKDLLQVQKDRRRFKDSIASQQMLDIQTYTQRDDSFLGDIERQRPTSLIMNRTIDERSEKQMFGGSFKEATSKGTRNEVGITITPYDDPKARTAIPTQSTPEYYNTSNGQVHTRQSSTDTYLHLHDVALDSSSSAQTIDTIDRNDSAGHPKYSGDSFCSDDNVNGYTDSIQRVNATSVDTTRATLEEGKLREETLLRKRRNSLNLERDDMKERIDGLKESNKRNLKEITNQLERVTQISELSKKLGNIDKEIKSIDRKISVVPLTNTKKRKPSQKRNTNLITKFRNAKPKDMHLMAHAVSIESLTSTASHDSSIGRESPFSSQTMDNERNSYIPTVKPVQERTSVCRVENAVSLDNSPVEENGFAQLLRTTERLENGEFATPKKDLNEQTEISLSSRSKSMSAVDKIPQRSVTFTGKSADFIIEDFEKFSAMLMKKQLKTSITIEI